MSVNSPSSSYAAAFALHVLILCGVAMCMLYEESNKAMRVITPLCVNLADIKRGHAARV